MGKSVAGYFIKERQLLSGQARMLVTDDPRYGSAKANGVTASESTDH